MKPIWERDLGEEIIKQVWDRIVEFNQTFSVNTGIKENRYKLLNRWYYTPWRLAKMYQNTSDKCWCYGRQGASFWHIWWSCEKIFFWKQIPKASQQILGRTMPFHPRLSLLGDTNYKGIKEYKVLVINVLTGATQLIAANWKLQLNYFIWMVCKNMTFV